MVYAQKELFKFLRWERQMPRLVMISIEKRNSSKEPRSALASFWWIQITSLPTEISSREPRTRIDGKETIGLEIVGQCSSSQGTWRIAIIWLRHATFRTWGSFWKVVDNIKVSFQRGGSICGGKIQTKMNCDEKNWPIQEGKNSTSASAVWEPGKWMYEDIKVFSFLISQSIRADKAEEIRLRIRNKKFVKSWAPGPRRSLWLSIVSAKNGTFSDYRAKHIWPTSLTNDDNDWWIFISPRHTDDRITSFMICIRPPHCFQLRLQCTFTILLFTTPFSCQDTRASLHLESDQLSTIIPVHISYLVSFSMSY